VRVQIPSIGVDSALMALGLHDDGSLEVPPDAFPAGWYTGAPTPGQLGPSIITGHVRVDGRQGVFADLHNLKPGHEITVSRSDRRMVVFRVERVEEFPKEKFPTTVVYGDIDHAGLRLITCGDRRSGRYQSNVVVFAELVKVRTS
jgi:sortase (surface protein transpeptidase)